MLIIRITVKSHYQFVKQNSSLEDADIEVHLFSGTGNTVVKAVSVLKDHSVLEENIVLANLFCTPPATQTIVTAFPQVSTYHDEHV